MICFSEDDFANLKCLVDFEPECIAWNDEYEMYLSTDRGGYMVSVLSAGEVIDEGFVENWQDIEEYINAYFCYDYDEEEREWEIEKSEDALDEAVEYFISSILDDEHSVFGDVPISQEVIEDCKEHFLEYLYRKHGFNIRRPMVLEDENGEDFFEEYPYPCLVFEDKNPIYA